MDTLQKFQEIANRTFADHILTVELDTPEYKAYMLRAKPGERINGVLLLFCPEGIVITGDHSPDTCGCVTSRYHGLEWFCSSMDGEYLCGKFLPKVWVPEYAAQCLSEYAEESDQNKEEMLDLARRIVREGMSMFDFYDEMKDIDYSYLTDGGSTGYTYDWVVRTKLVAIQRRFAELYAIL